MTQGRGAEDGRGGGAAAAPFARRHEEDGSPGHGPGRGRRQGRRRWSLIAAALLAASPTAAGDTATMAAQIEMAAQARLAAVMASPGARLAPFTTDGCSGGLSAGWAAAAQWLPGFAEVHQSRPPWEACCVDHDRAYHAARGTVDGPSGFLARAEADRALGACVEAVAAERGEALAAAYGIRQDQLTAAYALIAAVMVQAVRLGGGPCTGLSWRWGYGWPPCRSAPR